MESIGDRLESFQPLSNEDLDALRGPASDEFHLHIARLVDHYSTLESANFRAKSLNKEGDQFRMQMNHFRRKDKARDQFRISIKATTEKPLSVKVISNEVKPMSFEGSPLTLDQTWIDRGLLLEFLAEIIQEEQVPQEAREEALEIYESQLERIQTTQEAERAIGPLLQTLEEVGTELRNSSRYAEGLERQRDKYRESRDRNQEEVENLQETLADRKQDLINLRRDIRTRMILVALTSILGTAAWGTPTINFKIKNAIHQLRYGTPFPPPEDAELALEWISKHREEIQKKETELTLREGKLEAREFEMDKREREVETRESQVRTRKKEISGLEGLSITPNEALCAYGIEGTFTLVDRDRRWSRWEQDEVQIFGVNEYDEPEKSYTDPASNKAGAFGELCKLKDGRLPRYLADFQPENNDVVDAQWRDTSINIRYHFTPNDPGDLSMTRFDTHHDWRFVYILIGNQAIAFYQVNPRDHTVGSGLIQDLKMLDQNYPKQHASVIAQRYYNPNHSSLTSRRSIPVSEFLDSLTPQ